MGQGPLDCDAQVILVLSDLLLSSKRYGKSSLNEVSMPWLNKWLSSLLTVYEFYKRLWKESRRRFNRRKEQSQHRKEAAAGWLRFKMRSETHHQWSPRSLYRFANQGGTKYKKKSCGAYPGTVAG